MSALVLLAATGGGLLARGADWPCAGGPDANFQSAEKGIVTDFSAGGDPVLWRTQVSPGFAGVSVSSGSVFTVSISDGFKMAKKTANGRGAVCRADDATDAEIAIYRLDAATGQAVWVHRYRVPARFQSWHWSKEMNPNVGAWYGPKAEPTVDGEWLYVLDHTGVLTCLSVRDGTVRWSAGLRERFKAVPPKFGYSCPPLIVEEKVIVPLFQDDGCLVALNKQTGEVIWRGGSTVRREEDKHRWDGYSLPVTLTLGDRTQVVYFTGAGVMGLDIETGAVLWTYPLQTFTGEVAPKPIVQGTRIFISTVYSNPGGLLLEVGADGAKKIWDSWNLKNHFANMALYQGFLYGTSGYDFEEKRKPMMRCLDFASGEMKWTAPEYREQPDGPPQQAQLIAADSKLIILTGFGDLILAEASPEQYREISHLRLKVEEPNCQWWPRMALADRRLYCRTTAGEVLCVALDGTKREGSAPLLSAEKTAAPAR
ncbi:MAG: PQQ-like beta-propeller repeat protein [Kiritimatiellaceae bacterium]|nr:PQQ-like beta-propeller repeat protein [Kiritimatiellaceae bacterium]